MTVNAEAEGLTPAVVNRDLEKARAIVFPAAGMVAEVRFGTLEAVLVTVTLVKDWESWPEVA